MGYSKALSFKDEIGPIADGQIYRWASDFIGNRSSRQGDGLQLDEASRARQVPHAVALR